MDAPDVVRTILIERLDLNTTDVDEDLETTRLFMVKTRPLRCSLKFTKRYIIFNGSFYNILTDLNCSIKETNVLITSTTITFGLL